MDEKAGFGCQRNSLEDNGASMNLRSWTGQGADRRACEIASESGHCFIGDETTSIPVHTENLPITDEFPFGPDGCSENGGRKSRYLQGDPTTASKAHTRNLDAVPSV